MAFTALRRLLFASSMDWKARGGGGGSHHSSTHKSRERCHWSAADLIIHALRCAYCDTCSVRVICALTSMLCRRSLPCNWPRSRPAQQHQLVEPAAAAARILLVLPPRSGGCDGRLRSLGSSTAEAKGESHSVDAAVRATMTQSGGGGGNCTAVVVWRRWFGRITPPARSCQSIDAGWLAGRLAGCGERQGMSPGQWDGMR